MKFEGFAAWANENPSKIYQNPPWELAGRPQICPELAGRAPDLRNLENPRKMSARSPKSWKSTKTPGAKNPFLQVKKRKKMFWVRCVVSKSLIPQHVEFSTFLKPSPPNALFEFRDSGQPPHWSMEGKSTNIDKNK